MEVLFHAQTVIRKNIETKTICMAEYIIKTVIRKNIETKTTCIAEYIFKS